MTTAVFFHAHPDDEALMTGGTMARLAAAGHRVVLVTATAGEAGLAAAQYSVAGSLAPMRLRELEESAQALGCQRVVVLGYPDSGSAGTPTPGSFATVPVEQAAHRLAEVLDEEHADLLTGYDRAGGYGHPDHVRVHHVARAAARLAGTPALLEATVDRRALQRALRVVAPFTRGVPDLRPARFAERYAAPEDITHRITVRAFADQKRAAMRAHASQRTGGGDERALQRFLALPRPVFTAVFGREWFIDPAVQPTRRKLGDPFGHRR